MKSEARGTMIPLKTHRRTTRWPVVTWLIGAICVATLVRLAALPAVDAARIVTALAVVPARLFGPPVDPESWLTLVSSAFFHAGWVHLAGNLLYLFVFGPGVEERLGRVAFTGLYLASGVIGALSHAFAHPSSTAPLVGASGAIAGLLGAHLVLEPRMRVTTLIGFEVAHLPAAFVVALWFLGQLASGLAPVTATAGATSIAWFAHLGGFTAGCILGAGYALKSPRTGRRGRTRPRTRAKSSGPRKAA